MTGRQFLLQSLAAMVLGGVAESIAEGCGMPRLARLCHFAAGWIGGYLFAQYMAGKS